MYSYPNKTSEQNNKMNKIRASQIKIEYEKIPENLNSQLIQSDENDNENFNVYFMKSDIKYKTISNSNLLTSSKIKKLNQTKIEQKNEKEFKSHLIKKLKSLKLGQKNKDKIPLNIASKIRREESIRNSLKYLLSKQAQFDPKKELLYYKAYFRFWKRKCKYEKYDNKKINKKDKNIRITTVIYKAEKPKTFKNNAIIEENKNENNKRKNEIFRNKLVRIIESKSKDKKIQKETKENNNNNYKYQENNSKNSLIININNNLQPNPNNIKTIKNIINENKINHIYTQNKKCELNNIKKEALNKINKNIKKEFKFEGFNILKKFRNKSREKEGTEKLNIIFKKKNILNKEEALNKIRKNIEQEFQKFNKEEKWTKNKFNWKVGELTKNEDSLYGLSNDEELKDSKNENKINEHMNKVVFESNIDLENKNNKENLNDNNEGTNIENNNQTNFENNKPLYYEENGEEYEILSGDEENEVENIGENEDEEFINFEEMENNKFEDDGEEEVNEEEEYNGEEEINGEEEYNGKEEYNEEEEFNGEEMLNDNEYEEEMEEMIDENNNENGLDYLKDEVEEMMNEGEEEEYEEENNENEKFKN